ncbi:MAG: 1-acyl-sn-glycerol-3-phosphate acyltransferase [Dokdonella sp.]|uniref:lysophospholipid acyltransferase family protein n=1 Tax=Dokdonella sp. TaxID=2291710 RepID=UPI002C3A1C61|nr:1-acyl-sn-glycerol-3-phosphate acyltransferase [Dokdonella sp.]HOX71162.1 1-acyl-sn-glycerol-3-phosphate acyltransferase [Dokdonella sp.]HPN78760.1 1-acyl-sn-glycerol-3-phosphate acyltransferase [Dokdonella sp.]
MNSAADRTDESPRRDAMRPLRYVLRTPFVLLHIVFALPLAVIALNPLLARIPVGRRRFDQFMISWWSGTLVRLFGFRIRAFGAPLGGSVMYVANHVSWLDIELMHSQRAISFVAKSEIAGWPLVGWLATRAGTIYHQRGSSDSMTSVIGRVIERLRAGEPVGIFPEGGTGRGDRVRTFHARIFQAALDADVPVQPVALRYGRNGRQDPSMPFGPNESFFANLLRILGNPPVDAEVHFLEPVESTPDARRRMAEESRARIVRTLGYGDS